MFLDLFLQRPTIKVIDMNDALINPTILGYLKALTLHGESGMTMTLNRFQTLERRVEAKAIIAFVEDAPAGWLLYSKEPTDIIVTFRPEMGVYVQVFVDYNHRRRGIGTALLSKARELAKEEALCVCKWSEEASAFFGRNEHKNVKDVYNDDF